MNREVQDDIIYNLMTWNPIFLKTELWQKIPLLMGDAIKDNNELLVNILACYRVVFRIKAGFLYVDSLIRNKKYQKAWNEIENTIKDIELLKGTNEFSNDWLDDFQIDYIHEYLLNLEQLYPYSSFLSREVIIKKQRCSICGEIKKMKNGCRHEVGKLYNGNFCRLIWEDYKFVGVAYVNNPKDKYTVLTPEGAKYQYDRLKWITSILRTPYIKFVIENNVVIIPKHIKNLKPMPKVSSPWKNGFEPRLNEDGTLSIPETLIFKFEDAGTDNTEERELELIKFLKNINSKNKR